MVYFCIDELLQGFAIAMKSAQQKLTLIVRLLFTQTQPKSLILWINGVWKTYCV